MGDAGGTIGLDPREHGSFDDCVAALATNAVGARGQ